MTSRVDQHQWRAPSVNKRVIGLGIQGFTGPEEVFDGLFWVPPTGDINQIDRWVYAFLFRIVADPLV